MTNSPDIKHPKRGGIVLIFLDKNNKMKNVKLIMLASIG